MGRSCVAPHFAPGSLIAGHGNLSLDLKPRDIEIVIRFLAYFMQIHTSGQRGWPLPHSRHTEKKEELSPSSPSERRMSGETSEPSDSSSSSSTALKWSAGTQSSNCSGKGLSPKQITIALSLSVEAKLSHSFRAAAANNGSFMSLFGDRLTRKLQLAVWGQ